MAIAFTSHAVYCCNAKNLNFPKNCVFEKKEISYFSTIENEKKLLLYFPRNALKLITVNLGGKSNLLFPLRTKAKWTRNGVKY